MNKWENVELKEIKVSETEYGGTITSEFDAVYVNDNGNWEGTFVKNPS